MSPGESGPSPSPRGTAVCPQLPRRYWLGIMALTDFSEADGIFKLQSPGLAQLAKVDCFARFGPGFPMATLWTAEH